MASIGVIHNTVSSDVATAETSYQAVLESDALTSGTTYHVICHAIHANASHNALTYYQIIDKTNGDAVLDQSTMVRKFYGRNKGQSYYYLGKITAGGDGGGIELQQKVADGTVTTEFVSMMLLDLSNMDEADYFFASDSTATEHTTSYVDRASITNPDPRTNDEYVVWGWLSTTMDDTTASVDAYLGSTEPAATTHPRANYEAKDAGEQLNTMFCRYYEYGGVNKDITWTISSKDELGGSALNDYEASAILGLRLNAFKNFSGEYEDTETVNATTGYQEMNYISVTPTNSGRLIATACCVWSPAGVNRSSQVRIQVNNSTSPNAAPDSALAAMPQDANDELPLSYITGVNGVADTGLKFDLDVAKTVSNSVGWKMRSLVAFTEELQDGDVSHKNNVTGLRSGSRLGNFRNKRIRR